MIKPQRSKARFMEGDDILLVDKVWRRETMDQDDERSVLRAFEPIMNLTVTELSKRTRRLRAGCVIERF